MRFKLGEHVKATRLGWFGQVVGFNDPNYDVRVGGTNRVRSLTEGELEPIIPDRRVAPVAFPPLNIVAQGGSITLPTLAYPFSNEKGLQKEEFWTRLNGQVDHGAFVGVSGSILDFACKYSDYCQQIISTDINTETVKAIDALRSVVALLNGTTITYTRRHWKTGEILAQSSVTSAEFLKEVFGAYRSQSAGDVIPQYTCMPENKSRKIAAALRQLETNCYGKLNFSSWYKDPAFIACLGTLIARGKFNIICGDLQNIASQRSLKADLKVPVSLFNFSNALDYIKRPNLIAELFETMSHSSHAKVITSSQVPGLEGVLGTFDAAAILDWDVFIGILRREDLSDHFGRLLDTI